MTTTMSTMDVTTGGPDGGHGTTMGGLVVSKATWIPFEFGGLILWSDWHCAIFLLTTRPSPTKGSLPSGQALFCTHSTPFMFPGFLENWVFAILELSFSKIWKFLAENSLKISFFKQFLVKIFRNTLFLRGLELSFQAKTEFFKIFGIWVFENLELSFSVLYKKKPVFILALCQNSIHQKFTKLDFVEKLSMKFGKNSIFRKFSPISGLF